MSIYVDISQFVKTRIMTGIQRVIREFLNRALYNLNNLKVIYFDMGVNSYIQISNNEVLNFLKDVQNYQMGLKNKIDIFDTNEKINIFFDIDSVWNAELRRISLYKKLKENNFKIINFIYDLIPILFPDYLKDETKRNYSTFLDTVYSYSDLVVFDSISAQNDFLMIKDKRDVIRKIETTVVYLGSDFNSIEIKNKKNYDSLLNKKYILFVGTLEPRKKQDLVLEAYEQIQQQYPNINLVFVGQVGWKVDSFVNILDHHPLKDKSIHHLEQVDDFSLNKFYKNAFIVTYLSKYEGYGLPIAESLQSGNITIVSKNSSIPEVGLDFVEYLEDDSITELQNIIINYLKDDKKYNDRKKYIKENYKVNTWDNFYFLVKKELLKQHQKG